MPFCKIRFILIILDGFDLLYWQTPEKREVDYVLRKGEVLCQKEDGETVHLGLEEIEGIPTRTGSSGAFGTGRTQPSWTTGITCTRCIMR